MESSEKPSFFDAIRYDGEVINLPCGCSINEEELSRNAEPVQVMFLKHLRFLKRLQEQQEFNVPVEALMDKALQLTKISERSTSMDILCGIINEVVAPLDSIAESLSEFYEEEDDEGECPVLPVLTELMKLHNDNTKSSENN